MKQAENMSANSFVGECSLTAGQHWDNLVNTDSVSHADLFSPFKKEQ